MAFFVALLLESLVSTNTLRLVPTMFDIAMIIPFVTECYVVYQVYMNGQR